MRKDYNERKTTGDKGQRIMLYIHGGAYFFGAVDEHRYQIQRHARKLRARVLAPRYRLAPQFPFPCGLLDAVAAYLYLLDHYEPANILLAGDSAGGGMVLSVLVTLRDQGIPLPAGAILLSPWVDLAHSFPSVAGDDTFDYIPNTGFHQRPSMAWPPPSAKDMNDAVADATEQSPQSSGALQGATRQQEQDAARGYSVTAVGEATQDAAATSSLPSPGRNLTIELDGSTIEIVDQIQMYATNQLLAHPLVSPVQQPSLGGLPPLLIQVGGGELLRDEQIYLAHKAANPLAYPPGDAIMKEHDPHKKVLKKYPPTNVHLQVWEDLCHVPHTLSFTKPAKYMYRGVAQFGYWAYANAQRGQSAGRNVEGEKEAVSIISSNEDTDTGDSAESSTDLGKSKQKSRQKPATEVHNDRQDAAHNGLSAAESMPTGTIGRGGDPIPPFQDHMIRERVTRHGTIYPLAPASQLEALNIDPNTIGMIKEGPVRRWIAKQKEWDQKFGREKRSVQKQRAEEMATGYDVFFTEDGRVEIPPPSALAGRRKKGVKELLARKKGKSWGLAMWSGWGSKHDETTLDRQDVVTDDKASQRTTDSVAGDGRRSRGTSIASKRAVKKEQEKGNNPPTRTPIDHDQPKDQPLIEEGGSTSALSGALPAGQKVEGSESTFIAPSSLRPHNGRMAFPFKLRPDLADRNASMMTLHSMTSQKTVSSSSLGDRSIAHTDDLDGVNDEKDNVSQVGNGVVSGNGRVKRPEPERFVTAAEF